MRESWRARGWVSALGLVVFMRLASAQSGWIAALPEVAQRVSPSGPAVPKESPTPIPPVTEPPVSPVPKLVVEQARQFRRNGDWVVAEGDVRLRYGEDVIQADRVEGNLRTQDFRLEGNARLDGPGLQVTGARVEANLERRTYRVENGRAEASPATLRAPLSDDVYLTAREARGEPGRFLGTDGDLTTCDHEHPHYAFGAHQSDVRFGNVAILRRVHVEVLGRRLFTLPTLSIPLTDDAERFLPEVGRTTPEGYFAKFRFAVPLRGDRHLLDARVDYFTRLGPALGLDYRYAIPGTDAIGLARVYSLLQGSRANRQSLDHRMGLVGGDLRLEFSREEANYWVAPDQIRTVGRIGWLGALAGGQTRLSATLNQNRSPGFSNRQSVLSVNHQATLGQLRTGLDVAWSGFESGRAATRNTREQVDVRVTGRQPLGPVDATLEYQRLIPVAGNATFFGASDRTPLLSLESDARRLLGPSAGARFPWRAAVSWGELKDSTRRQSIQRTFFEWSASRPLPSSDRSGTSYQLRFRQGIYSDDTAQFAAGVDVTNRWVFAPRSSINLRYHYLRPQGYTPLSIDRSGRVDEFSLDVTYRPHGTLELSAQTGHDLLASSRGRPAWQTVGLRSEWRPNERFQARTSFTYDPFRQVWSNLRADAGWLVAGGFAGLGVRFDGGRHTWSDLNLLLTDLQWGKTGISLLATYNGFSRRIEQRQVKLVYDLHCVDAVLEYRESTAGYLPGRQFSVYVRIKAFPSSSGFGLGNQGQPIGTGTGVRL